MINYTVKLVLWTHDSNHTGCHPIYIRITINRQQRYIATGHFVKVSDWDEENRLVKKSNTEHTTINAAITTKANDVLNFIVRKVVNKDPVTSQLVKEHFTTGDQNNIFLFLDKFIAEVQHKREGSTLENYRKHMLRLELYHGSRELTFEQITTDYLQAYETLLRSEVGNNYITALFKTLRTIFNAAIKKGVIKPEVYPFKQYEYPVYVPPVKDCLTFEEVLKVDKLADEITDPIIKQTVIYFLLGCFTGFRISDWHEFDISKNLQKDRVKLRPKKTSKKTGEWVSMPVHYLLRRTLERIRHQPLTIPEPYINTALKELARMIGTKKRITSHTARHTFAVTMCAERGISSETCAELMGITIATCVENYYRVNEKKIDFETKEAWKELFTA